MRISKKEKLLLKNIQVFLIDGKEIKAGLVF
jgi:hypothetical protein